MATLAPMATRRSLVTRGLSLVVVLVLGFLVGGLARRALARSGARVACPGSSSAVVVDTALHVLAACEGGRAVDLFSVRLGWRGTGKRREGDGKTPLGSYALDEPRASVAYGLFVPVGYPTPAQQRAGFTGGAIGIHGPDRRVRWAGSLVNLVDSTDGCLGIATDEEMSRLASWIRRRDVRTLVVR